MCTLVEGTDLKPDRAFSPLGSLIIYGCLQKMLKANVVFQERNIGEGKTKTVVLQMKVVFECLNNLAPNLEKVSFYFLFLLLLCDFARGCAIRLLLLCSQH